jgi:hypothetical protein
VAAILKHTLMKRLTETCIVHKPYLELQRCRAPQHQEVNEMKDSGQGARFRGDIDDDDPKSRFFCTSRLTHTRSTHHAHSITTTLVHTILLEKQDLHSKFA